MNWNRFLAAIASLTVTNFVTLSSAQAEPAVSKQSETAGGSESKFTDLLKEFSNRLKGIKPTDLGFNDDRMYSEEELSRDVREIQFPAEGLTKIRFLERVGNKDIRVVKSQDDTVTILITVLADPEHKQLVTSLSKALDYRREGQIVSIFQRNSNYGCFTYSINGRMELKGACYASITVALPENSNVSIYNDDKRVHGPVQAMTANELIESLNHGIASDRMKKISEFKRTASSSTQLSAQEMEEILESFITDSDKLAAFKETVSFLNPDERAAFSNKVEDIWMLDQNQKKVFQILALGNDR